MEKNSTLYRLMDVRMNGVMNDIVGSDGNTGRSSGGSMNTPANRRR